MTDFILKDWLSILIAFGSAFIITWYYVPKIIIVVRKRHLEDKPERHKIHRSEVPTLGGIGIFSGFIFGYLISVNGRVSELSFFTAAIMLLFFVGVKDDLVYLHPKKKFIGEIISALIIILFTDLRITHLHGFMGATDISSVNSFIITLLLFIVIINAVNFIDGIDGLAASIGIITSVLLGVFFWLSGDHGYAMISAAFAGALIAFMRYNLSNDPSKKIFMGDTGSLILGFTLTVFTIHFNELIANGKPFIKLHSAPAFSIALLILPLFDSLRVIILRLYNKQPVFVADHRHIHHLMLRAGFTHRQATWRLSLFNVSMIAITFLLDPVGIFPLTIILLSLCLAATYMLIRVVRRKESVLQKPAVGVSEVSELTIEKLIKTVSVLPVKTLNPAEKAEIEH
jgi:UDP-N-acetylmuramyl pentapeptide phosphotransferase/UDP-N-acetylglucosamine-1-phosphate transferase